MRKSLRMGARRKGDPLPTLGDLRKGLPKSDKGVGKELTDFRVCNYDESDEQLIEFIKSIGKTKPDQGFYTVNHLQFVFPEPTVAGNLMVFNECYKGGIMIHRCTPDEDRIVVRALDPVTFAPIVVNGHDVKTGEIVRCDDKPIYSYHSDKYGTVQVGCSPVVRMKVMLRGQGRIGTWDVLSTSGIDGEHLTQQLETFYSAFSQNPILRDNGLRGIPFILHRMPPQDVPYYDDGGARKTGKHSFISIEIAPDFGGLFMESTIRYALQAVKPAEALPAPTGPQWDETDNDELLNAAEGGVKAEIVEGATGASPESVSAPKQTVLDPDYRATEAIARRAASVKFNGMTYAEWHNKADEFCNAHPNWTKGNKPDLQHVLVSAARAGFDEVNGTNVETVFAAIVAAHEAKA